MGIPPDPEPTPEDLWAPVEAKLLGGLQAEAEVVQAQEGRYANAAAKRVRKVGGRERGGEGGRAMSGWAAVSLHLLG